MAGLVIGRWWAVPLTFFGAVLAIRYGGHGILETDLVWFIAIISGGFLVVACAIGVALRRFANRIAKPSL